MLKILVADDEPKIRKGLIHLIDWNAYGFTIAGAVSNGVEALDFIQREDPDVLITDIRMPDMDGLQLIENIRAFNDKIRIIILSGHNTFSYAQKVLQYNAERYLLKPIEEDELIECLDKIRREYEENQAASKTYTLALLRTFLSGQPVSSLQAEKNFPGGTYYYILAEPHIGDSALFTSLRDDYVLQLKSAVDTLLSDKKGIFILPEQVGAGIVINSHALKSHNGNVSEFAKGLITELEGAGIYADILVGCHADCISELHKSGDSIKICREKKFYSGAEEHVIICNGDREFSLGLSQINLPDELVKATVYGGFEGIKQSAAVLCAAFQNERVSPGAVMQHIDNILVELLKEVESMGGNRARLLVKRVILDKAVNVTINTVRIFLEELCKEAADIIAELRRNLSTDVVGDVVLYVRENYKNDMDLKLLAEKFFMNPRYLGRLFKKSTGRSFNTFLNEIRMEQAKKLLRRSNCKINDVANQVGFKESSYFIVKFEELEGVTPTQYRDSHQKKPSSQ